MQCVEEAGKSRVLEVEVHDPGLLFLPSISMLRCMSRPTFVLILNVAYEASLLTRYRITLSIMADAEEVPDTQDTSVKPPSLDIESLQRKKFKTDELPLAPAQHSAIQSLLHSFKKKGSFDSVRKGIFEEFNNGVLQFLQF